MNYLNQLINEFLFAIGFGLAFLLMHVLQIYPGICK